MGSWTDSAGCRFGGGGNGAWRGVEWLLGVASTVPRKFRVNNGGVGMRRKKKVGCGWKSFADILDPNEVHAANSNTEGKTTKEKYKNIVKTNQPAKRRTEKSRNIPWGTQCP